MQYTAKITVFNSNNNYYEDWDLMVDIEENEFYVIWSESGFDIEMSEAWPKWFEKVKWSDDSRRVMIIGVFEVGIK